MGFIKTLSVCLSIAFALAMIFFGNIISNKNSQIEILNNNNKAYELEILDLSHEKGAFLMTISEIENSKDSLVMLLNTTRKELGIKDKELNQALTFRSTIRETVIVERPVKEIVIDSITIPCRFNEKVIFNDYTSVYISLQDSLHVDIEVTDRFQVFDYSRKV